MRARSPDVRRSWPGVILSLCVLASVSVTSGCGSGAPLGPIQVPAVTPSDVDSITVQPSTVEVSRLNEQIHFTATALGPAGGVVDDAPVSWSSSDISVVTVNQSGTATILREGEVEITASYGAASGTATVTVTPTLNP